ncbi:MAG: hypothetical protein ACRENB_17465 [Gemmatimonadales bacterium]
MLAIVVMTRSMLDREAPTARRALTPLERTVVSLPRGLTIPFGEGRPLALSPRGDALVYRGRDSSGTRLYLQLLPATAAPRAIAGTDEARDPLFSPDGSAIAFRVGAELRRVTVGGSGQAILARTSTGFAAWSDQSLVLTDTSGSLLRLDDGEAGAGTLIARPDHGKGETVLAVLGFVRDGSVLVAERHGGITDRISVQDVTTRTRTRLLAGGVMFAASMGDRLVYQRDDGSVSAAPFDAGTPRLLPPPTELERAAAIVPHAPAITVSPAGVALLPLPVADLLEFSRDGRSRELSAEPRTYHHPRFSPEGRRLLADFEMGGRREVSVLDLAQGLWTRVTTAGDASDAVWSPDGQRIAYLTRRGGPPRVYATAADGAGAASPLVRVSGIGTSGVWLDSERLLTTRRAGAREGTGFDLVIAAGDSRSPVVATPAHESWPAVSADRRRVAWVSSASGRSEAWARAIAHSAAPPVMISSGGGTEPVWSGNGELFYLEPREEELVVMAARLEATDAALRVVDRRPLFTVRGMQTAISHANWDASPDGRRFVFVRPRAATQVVLWRRPP